MKTARRFRRAALGSRSGDPFAQKNYIAGVAAGAFFAALRAVFFFAAFFAAGLRADLAAAPFLAVVFFAVDFFAVDFLAVFFLAAMQTLRCELPSLANASECLSASPAEASECLT
jgi:hypothetical protein